MYWYYPMRLRGPARIIARNSAQQAVRGRLLGGVGGVDVAQPEVQRVGADGIEACRGALEVGEVHGGAELATEHRLIEGVGIVDHRQHVRQRALHVGFRIAVVVDRPDVEIAAVAAPGEVELRHALGERVEQWIDRGRLQLPDLVVLEEGPVREPDRIEAPGPLGRQVEASARFDAAAPVPEARRYGAVPSA